MWHQDSDNARLDSSNSRQHTTQLPLRRCRQDTARPLHQSATTTSLPGTKACPLPCTSRAATAACTNALPRTIAQLMRRCAHKRCLRHPALLRRDVAQLLSYISYISYIYVQQKRGMAWPTMWHQDSDNARLDSSSSRQHTAPQLLRSCRQDEARPLHHSATTTSLPGTKACPLPCTSRAATAACTNALPANNCTTDATVRRAHKLSHLPKG